jgi:DNA-directed RNA polymerase subunit beta
MPTAIKDNQIQDVADNEVDFILESPTRLLGSHTNLQPLTSAVHGTRTFYGARFFNQAMPIEGGEAPLVQNLANGETGESFDRVLGRQLGAIFHDADKPSIVKKVTDDYIELESPDGEKTRKDLYRHFLFNRKSSISNTPLVQPGDTVEPGQLLARSNFTDDEGNQAMGLNARIAVIPYKGASMDDAIVLSERFANRLKSQAAYARSLEYKNGIKGGKGHFRGLFRDKYTKDQLDKLNDDGVIEVGKVLEKGDPIILASRPRRISSKGLDVANLSRYMANSRGDASEVWEHDSPGMVVNVTNTRNGVKVDIESVSPTKVGDKVTLRNGAKSIVSQILSDDEMPKTEDGEPLDVLMNPLSIPSRVNVATPLELALGKLAKKQGKPIVMPAFPKKGESLVGQVREMLDKAGIPLKERLYDPKDDRWIDSPVMVGNGFVQKLHHVVASKESFRGQGSYDQWDQPQKGGFEGGQAKRMSGLETTGLLSAGAYDVLRESATVRGQKNDQFWRDLRMGENPKAPGVPFAFDKFLTLLQGAGYKARKIEGQAGGLRLGFMTDRVLDSYKPLELENGGVVNLNDLSPVKGGLFDDKLTGANRWGQITLPHPMPNPAAELAIRKLLGLTEKQFREILAGNEPLPEHLLKK